MTTAAHTNWYVQWSYILNINSPIKEEATISNHNQKQQRRRQENKQRSK